MRSWLWNLGKKFICRIISLRSSIFCHLFHCLRLFIPNYFCGLWVLEEHWVLFPSTPWSKKNIRHSNTLKSIFPFSKCHKLECNKYRVIHDWFLDFVLFRKKLKNLQKFSKRVYKWAKTSFFGKIKICEKWDLPFETFGH